jgi:hypothetical protein
MDPGNFRASPGVTNTLSVNPFSGGIGFLVTSSAVGDLKWLGYSPSVPPGFRVTGVRLCYALADAASFVSQIRLSQTSDPPTSAVVRLDDGTDRLSTTPVCIDSATTSVDPEAGSIEVALRLNFTNTAHSIRIIAVGAYLQRK